MEVKKACSTLKGGGGGRRVRTHPAPRLHRGPAISSPDGMEWFTARVEEVECQWPPHNQVVPVSLLTSGL